MTLSPRFRITTGLASVLLSVMLAATVLHLVPNRREAVLEGRTRLCEAMAVNSSVLISREDLQRLKAILVVLTDRDESLLSAGIRREDGELVVEVGEHSANWEALQDGQSSDVQVLVPLNGAQGKWGALEVRFTPLHGNLWFELTHSMWLRLTAFLVLSCSVAWYFYLGKVLGQINPSQAVPRRVRNALDTLAEGLLVLDRKGRIVLCNQALALRLGHEPDELTGRDAAELPWQDDPQTLGLRTFPWDRVLHDGAALAQATLRLRSHDGRIYIFQTNCSPVLAEEGNVRGTVCGFEDVTELETQKLELATSKANADAANAAKSVFLANMSHEIRTPLNAVMGFTEVLRRGLYDNEEQRQEYLGTIHSSGQHLLRLINDILDLSKVEAGRLEVERLPCSPHQLLLDVINVLRVRANEKSLRLECSTPDGLPEVIETDAGRLRQILTNLVGNALKFTESGAISVVARMSWGTKPLLQIEVSDTGVGIPELAQQTIFEPFTQADGSITRRFGGTGLGLTISRQFARALGGDITVSSTVGEGSTFKATLTVGEAALNARVVNLTEFTSMTAPAEVSLPARTYHFGPSRILLVDDGESNLQLIELILHRQGLSVVTASNGQEALDAVARENFDVILMDMQMPVMDGYEATRTLRSRGYSQPIVALTANAMRGDEEKCRAAGCSGFLTKPIDLDQLLATLSELLCGPRRACPDGAMTDPLPETTLFDLKLSVGPAPTEATSSSEPFIRSVGTSPTGADNDMSGLGSRSVTAPLGQAQRWQDSSDLASSTSDFPSAPRRPVTSTLSFDDPDFIDIVIGFVEKLRLQVVELQSAWDRRDLTEVARLAHWLKGAAGTMGFHDFTSPSTRLMLLAREGHANDIAPVLAEIQDLADAIELPQALECCGSTQPSIQLESRSS